MTGTPDWGALYARHREVMWRVAASRLRGTPFIDQVEDVINETMLSLIASPPENVRDWEALLVATVQRRAIDLLRSADARHTTPGLEDQELGHTQPGPDFAEDVAELLDRQRQGARAWETLNQLDERTQWILRRRIVLGQKQDEVAAAFGISRGRVSQITSQALRQLREALESGGGTP